MLLKKIIIFSGILCVSTALMANDNNPKLNAYEGQYVNFNAGGTFANEINQSGQTNSGFLGAAGNVFLGTTLNPYFGAEIGVGYYSFTSDGGATIASINLRFTAPVGSRLSLFAKVGAGYGEVTTRIVSGQSANISSGFVPALGLGIGYGLTEQWMLSLEANGAWFPQGPANGIVGGLTVGATRYW